jgi:hypothetical protein
MPSRRVLDGLTRGVPVLRVDDAAAGFPLDFCRGVKVPVVRNAERNVVTHDVQSDKITTVLTLRVRPPRGVHAGQALGDAYPRRVVHCTPP